jgi:Skp family chaperone for outer membrane proteins
MNSRHEEASMRWIVVTAVSLFVLSSTAFAQTFAPPASPLTPQGTPQVPKWARVAFFNVGRVMAESTEAKAGLVKLESLRTKRASEADQKAKAIESAQQSLQTAQPFERRAALTRDVEKLKVDLQRFLQDAQAELQGLEAELGKVFQKNLLAAVERVAKDKGVDLVFSQTDSNLAWGDPAFDLSSAIAEKMNAGPSK